MAALPRPPVVVRPSSADLFEHDDFRALVVELTRDSGLIADQVEFRLGYFHGDWAEPGWTWVEFILDETAEAAIEVIAAAIVMWGRRWIKKARERHPRAAPIKATIYGANGTVLRYVEVPPEE